jgi:hypothetical protein
VWTLLTVIVLTLALLVTGWSRTLSRYSGAEAAGVLCRDYYSLKYAVFNSSLEAQATLEFRTARLAREAQFASTEVQRDAEAPATAATRLNWVLSQPTATNQDIFANARPVAIACDDPWRFFDPDTQR